MFEQAHYQNDDAAREYLESVRWPNGPVCPHCGGTGNTTKLNLTRRVGVHQCNDCRKQFTVTVGTVFERSHIPLHKWLQATYLLCSSKKGMSNHQMHRMLGVTYKTAWFMTHRLREAMVGEFDGVLGGNGGTVEVDETYIGLREGLTPANKVRGGHHKNTVVSLVERGREVRSFHVEKANAETVIALMLENVDPSANIMTDESAIYGPVADFFSGHGSVRHMYPYREFSRGNVHTNTIEGFFSIFKRGMKGVYHHCSAEHLSRYVAEFDFRYNRRDVNDLERTEAALRGIHGKRLYYC